MVPDSAESCICIGWASLLMRLTQVVEYICHLFPSFVGHLLCSWGHVSNLGSKS